MPTFTSSYVGVTPANLSTTLDLEGIGAALIKLRPSLAGLRSGWSGPTTGQSSMINARNAEAPRTRPLIIPADDRHPERLHARYYFYETPKYLRDEYPNGSEQEQSLLRAIDVLVSRVDGTMSQFLVLFSAADTNVVARGPYKSMQAQMLGADDNSSMKIDSSQLHLGDADIFLWLLTRLRNPDLGGGTILAKIESVAGEDKGSRVTALSKGVDLDRPAFLIAVADVDKLGPVRLKLINKPMRGRVVFDLALNGSFRLVNNGVRYRDIQTDGEAKRWAAVNDLAHVLIPQLIAGYKADKTWAATGRSAEVRRAVEAILARYRDRFPDAQAVEASVAEPR